jgi:hypothetical protein
MDNERVVQRSLEYMEQKTKESKQMNKTTYEPKSRFLTKWQAETLTGMSPDTLKAYRRSGKLREGIEWFSLNSRVVRYSEKALIAWITNQLGAEGTNQSREQVQ